MAIFYKDTQVQVFLEFHKFGMLGVSGNFEQDLKPHVPPEGVQVGLGVCC
jgi:hypothetical protein